MIYLLDADNLGGVDHMTSLYQSPRLGNDIQDFQAQGVWGSLATAQDDKGERWLYTPMWGAPAKAGPKFPMTNGDAPNGSVMAFTVEDQGGKPALVPQWMSRDLNHGLIAGGGQWRGLCAADGGKHGAGAQVHLQSRWQPQAVRRRTTTRSIAS